MTKSVIFDLDGTLADTSGDLIAAANACFTGLGHGPLLDPLADAATAFAGGRAMLRLGFSRLGVQDEAQVDAQFDALLGHYAAAIDVHTQLYDGVVPVLELLRAQGYELAICTNKPEGLAVDLVEKLGIAGHFGALLGADTLPVRKPDPLHLYETIDRIGGDRARSALIGDTVTDAKTAQAAGVPCVLVTFGPTGQAVADLPHDALMDHYEDLPAIVEHLIT